MSINWKKREALFPYLAQAGYRGVYQALVKSGIENEAALESLTTQHVKAVVGPKAWRWRVVHEHYYGANSYYELIKDKLGQFPTLGDVRKARA